MSHLPKSLSDHSPILIKASVHPNSFKPHQIFRFENYWLEKEDINSLVLKSFTVSTHCSSHPMIAIHQHLMSLSLPLITGKSITVIN